MLSLVLDLHGFQGRPPTAFARYSRLLAEEVAAAAPRTGILVTLWETGPAPPADVIAVLDGSGRVDSSRPTLTLFADLAPFVEPRALPVAERWRRRFRAAWVARQSSAVLVPSQMAARAATQYLRVPGDRLAWIGSVGPGWRRAPRTDVEAFRSARGLPARYLARLQPSRAVDAAWARTGAGLEEGGLVSVEGFDEADRRLVLSGAVAAIAPSPSESTTITAWEAMAAGAPVLAAAGGAPAEVVGNAGIVVPAGSVEGWAEAMAAMLTDTPRRNAMAARGLRAAAEVRGGESALRFLAAAAAVPPGR